MKIETLLPLGKVDPGLRAAETPLNLAQIGADARLVEDLGYDRLVVEETKEDPFVIMGLAADATTNLGLGTSVVIAFPRAPAVTAMSAWTIQKMSKGRFCLGLGPPPRCAVTSDAAMGWNGTHRDHGCVTISARCGRFGIAGRTAHPWITRASTTS